MVRGMVMAILVALLVVFIALPILGLAFWLIISTAAVGLVLGGLGRVIIPGRQPIGLLTTILIGIAGSFAGTILGHVFGLGALVTLLLQIGVSASLVAVTASSTRRAISG